MFILYHIWIYCMVPVAYHFQLILSALLALSGHLRVYCSLCTVRFRILRLAWEVSLCNTAGVQRSRLIVYILYMFILYHIWIYCTELCCTLDVCVACRIQRHFCSLTNGALWAISLMLHPSKAWRIIYVEYSAPPVFPTWAFSLRHVCIYYICRYISFHSCTTQLHIVQSPF